MEKTEFKVTKCVDRPVVRIIHAEADNPARKLTVYLDSVTGEPAYPMYIEPVIPGITIALDSDTMSSCSFPPSVPDSMVDGFVEYLKQFHDTVSAARDLIREEQKIFENSRKRHKRLREPGI